MPIRPDLRKYYGPVWQSVRARILERAGGKFDAKGKYLGGARCEQCKVPDQQRVQRGRGGLWKSLLVGEQSLWRDRHGELTDILPCYPRVRTVRIVLTVAHLNHTPGDDRDENLKALCQWCHNHYDAPVRAVHARETRMTRKDKGRPLLA